MKTVLDVTDAAKLLRKELRDRFPGVKFSVRIDRFSMGESIDVRWRDGPATVLVDQVADKYSEIDRDPLTGEILSGSNRYVNVTREYSPEIQARVADEFRAGKYPVYPTEWNLLCMTDLYPGKESRAYTRDEITCYRALVKPEVASPVIREDVQEILQQAADQAEKIRYIQARYIQ